MGWAYSGYIHHVSLHTFYPHWEKSSWSKVSWELDQMKYSPLISSYTFCYPHWEKQVVNQKFHEGFISSYNTNCIHIFLFKILISHIDFQMCDFADVSNTLSGRTFQYIQRELPKVPAHIPVLVLVSNYMSPPLHPLSPCPPLTLLLPPPPPHPHPFSVFVFSSSFCSPSFTSSVCSILSRRSSVCAKRHYSTSLSNF